MQPWGNPDFYKLNRLATATFLRKDIMLSILDAITVPLVKIQEETLYTSQHNSSKIYLEKVLNDYYNIVGFDPNQHETTKKIYIENVAQFGSVFIYQPLENRPLYLGDSSNSNEVFITQHGESLNEVNFTIFVPDTIIFNEQDLRAQVDKYLEVGRIYNIETYTI